MPNEHKKKSSQVPGQFLGYSLQTTECLRQLLVASPGSFVSVEVIDDVGVENADGTSVAVQTKSALASNPISDRSEEWWKAVASWIIASTEKTLDCKKTTFQLHVFSPKVGPLAQLFAKANTHDEAVSAIEAARLELWGPSPEYPKKLSVADGLKNHVATVFGADPDVAARVVMAFTLTFGSGSSRDDVMQLLKSKIVPQDVLDHILDKCLGWVKSKIESAIEVGQPPAISVDDFLAETNAFVTKLRFENMLNDFSEQPSAADVEQHHRRTYVNQLRLIDADDDEVLRAINSYLRAATNRSEWASLFLVYADSFDEYEAALRTYWNNTKKQQELDYSAEVAEKRGQRLYLDCMKLRRNLEGREVPDDFTSGSFHMLADDSDLTLGWHPDFKQKLGEGA
jgi:hypothetical protein